MLILKAGARSENKRKAKYCRLAAAGKCRFQSGSEKRNRMANVIAGILRATPVEI